jgi:hypothetical protein
MWPDWINMLSWWQWSILAAIPPAIVALYFLKLRRRPLEVPSTYLWHKSIEDLRVNSLWQRLRRNALLWLQLLVIALAMLALARPGWHGAKLTGHRFVFLIDNSASMQATDVVPTRLDEAKRRAVGLIDQMASGDVAMVVSFADSARIEQTFTDSHGLLRRGVEAIRATDRTTSLRDAMQVAAGLANPGRSEEIRDTAMPAKVFILSDGKFDDVRDFSLGNLEPVFVPIGTAAAANVGILTLSTRRHELRSDQLQAFARLENFGPRDVSVGLELLLDGRMIDADRMSIAAAGTKQVAFDLGSVTSGVLTLRATAADHLAVDNEAYAVISPPRLANVLLLTPGNETLQWVLQTAAAGAIAAVQVQPPAFLKTAAYRKQAAARNFDFILYDRCRPDEMPQANTLFIGAVPPAPGWSAKPAVGRPQIIDVNPAHPIMQWIDMGNVDLAEATPLVVPRGGSVLVDSDVGPMLAIAPREAFEDAVLGFAILAEKSIAGGKPEVVYLTNWSIRASFPIFALNLLKYFGRQREITDSGSLLPGQPVTIRVPSDRTRLTVEMPHGTAEIRPIRPGEFSFTLTDHPGVYQVRDGETVVQRFAVNLFDRRESDIRPRAELALKIGHVKVVAQSTWTAARREIWRTLLGLALVVLSLEWYTYWKRISV